MSEQLKTFLVALGENPETLEQFKLNPDEVMEAHGLSDTDKALVSEGDRSKLQQATGASEEEVEMWIV